MIVSFDSTISQKLQHIRELEAYQAAILDAQAVIEFDRDGKILSANQRFLDMVGFTLHQVITEPYQMFVTASDRKSDAYRKFWQAVGQGVSHQGEFRIVGKQQREIWVSARFYPIAADKNAPPKILGFLRDITSEIQTQILSEGQISAINRAQIVAHFDIDGSFIWANEGFLQTFGYTLQELRGQNHSVFVAAQERDGHVYRNFWQQLIDGDYATNVFRRIGKDNRDVWIDASYDPIFDRSGKQIRIVLFAFDVTQRHLQNLEIKGLMDAVNRSRSSITFALDGTITDANMNFLNMVGYSLAELKGRHHRMFIDEAYASSSQYHQLWETVRNGQYYSSVFRYFAKGGREVWISATYNPIFGSDGRPFKIVKFARNITHIVEQRRSSEKLVDGMLDRIVGAVASVNDRSTMAVTASSQTADTVQAVAAAAEELNVSIREITESMSSSREAVETAIHESQVADDSTRRLAIQAGTMTNIVELIVEIAKRINLLSLNATIESARAGEAGRGFAIVANEVKSLAQQVASATGKISQEIEDMQRVVHEVVEGLGAIRTSVLSVQGAVISTASAVEEQSSVTKDISLNMQYAARSVGSVNDSLVDILQAVEQANRFAHDGKDIYSKAIADVTVI